MTKTKGHRLKVGFVIDDTLDKPDGVQQYVLALGAWLTGQGHEVHYLAGQSARTDLPHVHSLSRNVRVRFNGNRLSIPLPARRRAIRELLQREQFDVLHIQMPYSPFLAGRIIKAAPTATAIFGTFHILPYSKLVRLATRLLGVWLRPTLRRFDRTFGNSEASRRFGTDVFQLPDMAVLPNIADVSRFTAAKPFESYMNATRTILFLGRLEPRKGCASLLRAVAELRHREVASIRLVICGKGPLRGSLEIMAKELGIDDITEFTGFVSEADKPRYLASADIAVFPSIAGESFGIVLLEAMAAGRPVVLAGDNPGYRSVMAPRDVLLFPATDIPILADKLEAYLQDKGLRQKIVDWQSMYVRQFDTAAVGKRLLNHYREVLRNKPQP